MESIYYKPRNGSLQELLVSDERYRRVFRPEETGGPGEDEDGTAGSRPPPNCTGVVTSLYQQCMQLLSSFTHCFDSLVDFPEDFGREIFSLAVEKLAKDSESTRASLQVFTAAYPASFLPHCCLAASLPLINNYELCLTAMLSNTVQLELADCKLGDRHDLLAELPHLPALRQLGLAGNLLTDRGLARLLLPRPGLTRLVYLDLTGNPLCDRARKRVVALLAGLKILVLGQEDPTTGLAPAFRPAPRPALTVVNTQGWGASLLARWQQQVQTTKANQVKPKPSNGFYSKPALVTRAAEAKAQVTESRNKVMWRRLMASETTSQISQTGFSAMKRKRLNDDDEKVNSIKKCSKIGQVEFKGKGEEEFVQKLLDLYS